MGSDCGSGRRTPGCARRDRHAGGGLGHRYTGSNKARIKARSKCSKRARRQDRRCRPPPSAGAATPTPTEPSTRPSTHTTRWCGDRSRNRHGVSAGPEREFLGGTARSSGGTPPSIDEQPDRNFCGSSSPSQRAQPGCDWPQKEEDPRRVPCRRPSLRDAGVIELVGGCNAKSAERAVVATSRVAQLQTRIRQTEPRAVAMSVRVSALTPANGRTRAGLPTSGEGRRERPTPAAWRDIAGARPPYVHVAGRQR